MRPFPYRCAVTASLLLYLAGSFALAQAVKLAAPAPAAEPAAPPPAPKPRTVPNGFLPVCSTEKVNGDCYINVDRRYPITMPTFQMRRNAHISVYVFHAFPFETLTLDAGTANAYEGSDQPSAFVAGAVPLAKGAVAGTQTVANNAAVVSSNALLVPNDEELSFTIGDIQPKLLKLPVNPNVVLAQKIVTDIQALDALLTSSTAKVKAYFDETNVIYAEIREVESASPRPTGDLQDSFLPGPGVPGATPDPFSKYGDWRQAILGQLITQGTDTENLWKRLPVPCFKSGTTPTPTGLWLPDARVCASATDTAADSSTPLALDSTYDTKYKAMDAEFKLLTPGQPDTDTYNNIVDLKTKLDQRHDRVVQAVTLATTLLPTLITKYSTDMESLWENISLAKDASLAYVFVGVIRGPGYSKRNGAEGKILAPYKALGPSVPYTLNAQNLIANPLLGLPAATQKQALVTITALYAEPSFEVSTGAFLSWLPNRTFSNTTDVSVTNNVPASTDVRIQETKTSPPLVIPFVAANYRISREFTWLGGRRGAVYATAGVALNPYNTQVEYPIGFSISWRYLMISPLYHLGHDIHLTQGEQVNQIWCVYNANATSSSSPPACAGAPPAPSTKMFWTGQFALGISVRVPTTFSSTNH